MDDIDSLLGFNSPDRKTVPANLDDSRYYSLFNIASGAWYVIHSIAAFGNYDTLLDIFEIYRYRFLCPKCRAHINNLMSSKYYPPSRELSNLALFTWTVNFHNMVNTRIGKGMFSPVGASKFFAFIIEKCKNVIIEPEDVLPEIKANYMSRKDIYETNLEPILPNYDVDGVFKDYGFFEDYSKNSNFNEYKARNIMYTPYLLAANGMYYSAKVILEDIIAEGINHCIADKLMTVSSNKTALKILLELSGESEFYDLDKLYFELTELADIEGKVIINPSTIKNKPIRSHANFIEF